VRKSTLKLLAQLFLRRKEEPMASVNYVAAVGRLLMAAIFLSSGFHKLLTPDQTQAYIEAAHIPLPGVAYWATTAIETIGGLCLVLGLATRFAALILAAFSIAAAVVFHSNFSDQSQFINFMKNLAIAGGLLQVVAFGSGGLAITHRRRKSFP
jgi:putative oxidoreductase